jgi:hypothetical protein
VCARAGGSDFVRTDSARTVDMLAADRGRTLTFALIVARVTESERATS